jgi:hypothetical protein
MRPLPRILAGAAPVSVRQLSPLSGIWSYIVHLSVDMAGQRCRPSSRRQEGAHANRRRNCAEAEFVP